MEWTWVEWENVDLRWWEHAFERHPRGEGVRAKKMN
jgi:hypothetical protein